MHIEELIKKYGSQQRAANKLGVTQALINYIYNKKRKATTNLILKMSILENLTFEEVLKAQRE
ncbi:MAG: hypothetical protein U9N34_07665, partial [Candidatus Cloacimonadota bacterium]|nr:hypothetical protein [Candidatus Cloacimonadota bacterium]